MKFPLWLKYFLIGFAHIFVSLIVYAVIVYFDRVRMGDVAWISWIVLYTATLIGAIFLLYRITKKHNGYKLLWLTMIGYLASVALIVLEIAFGIRFGFTALAELIHGGTAMLVWILFLIPGAFLLTVIESWIIIYGINFVRWLKARKGI